MSFRIRGPNASCGMGVDDESKNTFLDLKKKKTHRYVIFKIDEKKKEVVVEKRGSPSESYEDFAESLPHNDCRYAVYDFDFVTCENCQKSKIFFITWARKTLEFVQRCFMRHPRIASDGRWMAFIMRFRRPIQRKWTSK